jgi:hypothetical protein
MFCNHRTSALAATALAMFATTPAAAVAPSGDPVLYWNELMLGAGYNPGQTRPAALLNVALHDAVNATLGTPDYPYLGKIATPGGDTRAAAAVAARNVLVTLYPGRTAEFDAALATQLALIPDGAAKTAGITTGGLIATAAIARRANDGSFDVVPYTPSGLPGRWAPTPPGFGAPVTPQQRYVDPWLIDSQSQFRAAPPPAIDSAEYAAAFNEVKDLGSAGSLSRTDDQSESARFWAAGAGPGPWIRAAIDVSESRGLSTLENAQILGKLTATLGDINTTVWDTKYEYDYWRPVTGIRRADEDGNAATLQDAGWTPYITTPPHPSYLSAHAATGGAAAAILASYLGADTGFCVTNSVATRCWDSFDAAAEDGAQSRLWGGIHWRFDNEIGLAMGRDVAAFTLGSAQFGAIPEPATWAMLLTGFGLIGTVFRRRRRLQATA